MSQPFLRAAPPRVPRIRCCICGNHLAWSDVTVWRYPGEHFCSGCMAWVNTFWGRGFAALLAAEGQSVYDRLRSCAMCEYFDGGGRARVVRARAGGVVLGDCLNRLSPHFTVASNDTCHEFTPNSSAGGNP